MNYINWQKELREHFSFLIDAGFSIKSFSKNSEHETYFEKEGIIIEVYFDTYRESMELVINEHEQRVNLLNYPKIENFEIMNFREAINRKMNLIQLFHAYRLLLMHNPSIYNVELSS